MRRARWRTRGGDRPAEGGRGVRVDAGAFLAEGSYWLELRADDPVGTAVRLGKPMFIAQGARDNQVTAADDLTRWQSALADRPNVTIRVYDADDHMFFPGEGPSTPAGYGPPQHVDSALIADVADWLTDGS